MEWVPEMPHYCNGPDGLRRQLTPFFGKFKLKTACKPLAKPHEQQDQQFLFQGHTGQWKKSPPKQKVCNISFQSNKNNDNE